jgi:hypothetical protein
MINAQLAVLNGSRTSTYFTSGSRRNVFLTIHTISRFRKVDRALQSRSTATGALRRRARKTEHFWVSRHLNESAKRMNARALLNIGALTAVMD